jgi:hypothetical protein
MSQIQHKDLARMTYANLDLFKFFAKGKMSAANSARGK